MAETPEAFHEEFVRAFVDGDTAALKALYDDDSRFISPAAGVDAHGRAEVDAAWDALASVGSVHRFEVLSREVTLAGDYAFGHMRALLHGRWAGADEGVAIPLRVTGPSDASVELPDPIAEPGPSPLRDDLHGLSRMHTEARRVHDRVQ